MPTELTGPLRAWTPLLTEDALSAMLRSATLPLPTLPAPQGSPGRDLLDGAARRSRELAATGWPRPRASDFSRYWRDGDRTAYETDVFALGHRLDLAALAAWGERGSHGDAPSDAVPCPRQARPNALAEVLDGVVATCELSTWCWPAHDDCHERRGWVLPDPASPYLDLGAGEQAARLAWTDALVGEQLEDYAPGTRERLAHEVNVRVLRPFLERQDWRWLGILQPANNWLAWICGNVLVAALRFAPDEATRARVVRHAVVGIDRFLATIPPDGAIDEGFAYWWEGAARTLEALDVLRHATAGALDGAAVPEVRELVAFPHRMQIGPEWVTSFSDSAARVSPGRDGRPWQVLHRWAGLVNEVDALGFASGARRAGVADVDALPPASGLGRLLAALRDECWLEAEAGSASASAAAPLPARVWLPSNQVLLARRAAGSAAGLTLMVKGGHNAESHNHLDVGNVAVALDGVPVAVDLGRATYTALTFSPRRYEEWHITSAWHCVPAPGGAEQGVGGEFAASDVRVLDGGAGLSLDLTACYPAGACESWVRSARLVAPGPDAGAEPGAGDGEAGVQVVDSWRGAPGSVVRWVLAGEVILDEGRALVRPLEGTRTCELTWSCDAPVTATLVRREVTDPFLGGTWGAAVHRLELTTPAPAATMRTTFRVRSSTPTPALAGRSAHDHAG